MKTFLGFWFLIFAGSCLLFALGMWAESNHRAWAFDSQTEEGTWKIELQTPPCGLKQDIHGNNTPDIEVVYPKNSGEPMSVECHSMPVGAR